MNSSNPKTPSCTVNIISIYKNNHQLTNRITKYYNNNLFLGYGNVVISNYTHEDLRTLAVQSKKE